MVLIINCRNDHVSFRSRAYSPGETIKCAFKADAKLGDLGQALEGLPWPPRLVCRGMELEMAKSLDQQGCKTKDTLYLLGALPNDACRAWGKTGRCPKGSRCPLAKSHTAKFSPRYVEHTATAELTGGSSSTTPSSSPNATPTISPREQDSPSTRLCRNWEATGSCPHGDSCHWAECHKPPYDLNPTQTAFWNSNQQSPSYPSTDWWPAPGLSPSGEHEEWHQSSWPNSPEMAYNPYSTGTVDTQQTYNNDNTNTQQMYEENADAQQMYNNNVYNNNNASSPQMYSNNQQMYNDFHHQQVYTYPMPNSQVVHLQPAPSGRAGTGSHVQILRRDQTLNHQDTRIAISTY